VDNAASGRIIELPRLAGDVESEANDINADGLVVGYSSAGLDGYRAVVWSDEAPHHPYDLNEFVRDSGWRLFSATAINNQGDIVGFGTLSGRPRAFMLSPSTRTRNPYDDQLRRQIFAQLAYVLFGLIHGEGGAVVYPPGRPVPVPPRDSLGFERLSSDMQDVLLHLAIAELGALIRDPQVKDATRQTALEEAHNAIGRLLGK
jgi:hypothetical protein